MSEKDKVNLKDIELKLIAELMKNSRRSDRELAKALRISQPTVSRIIKRLEKMGIIREYTMIPDFAKLGYKLMGVSFIKLEEPQSALISSELEKAVIEVEKNNPHASLMAVDGVGLQKDRMFITFYEDYSAYSSAMRLTKQLPHINIESVESFLVNLEDKNNYRILSMATIADKIILLSKKATSEGVES